jgi:DNA invertase Pin-like site-specific DNA recombinase
MTRPIALYARVSTADQRPDTQLDSLRRYAGDRGTEAREFIDHGVSGAKDRRPSLDRLLAACRRREVGAVVVTKLDRLARSVRHLHNLAAEFEALGVALVVLDQSIDTSTPTGRLLFTMLGAVAEFERELIRERTTSGVAAARRRGRHPGRPPVLDRRTEARCRRLASKGDSLRTIAEKVGVSRMTVQRALHGVSPAKAEAN